MGEKTAILLDGGFIKKKLTQKFKKFPTPQDIVKVCDDIMAHKRLANASLFRVFYYDAPPFAGSAANPISHATLNFSATPQAKQNRSLLDSLELLPDFAVRRGVIIQTGWKLGRAALQSLSSAPRPVEATDIVPDMEQKGVDLRFGLDIATIALRRVVDTVVL